MGLWFFHKVVSFVLAAMLEGKCCKRWHIIFSTFSLKFLKCKICVQREVILSFKNHILVKWPFTNLFILRKWCGFEKPNHHYFDFFQMWPTYRFSKAKSYNFHFHKNDVTWPLSANGLLNGWHCIKVWFKTYPMCDAPIPRPARPGFAPSRVWTEALSGMTFAEAQTAIRCLGNIASVFRKKIYGKHKSDSET